MNLDKIHFMSQIFSLALSMFSLFAWADATSDLNKLIEERNRVDLECQKFIEREDSKFAKFANDKSKGAEWTATVLDSMGKAPPVTVCHRLYQFIYEHRKELTLESILRADMATCCPMGLRANSLRSIASMATHFKLNEKTKKQATIELLTFVNGETAAPNWMGFLGFSGVLLSEYINNKMFKASPELARTIDSFNKKVRAAMEEERSAKDKEAYLATLQKSAALREELSKILATIPAP